nr:hypothetical protein [Tanacetum cinerariifolium]
FSARFPVYRFFVFSFKRDHHVWLASIDAKVDQGCASKEDLKNRRDSIKILDEIQCLESKDLASKAKVKWAIEGDENTSFFHGQNILDGPLILNEFMAWYHKHKKELMVFKVDFEKAFDSLRWDYLDLVMEKLGFRVKWRSWIVDCFQNARSSVLINGSPTLEFDICSGLRHGVNGHG